MTISGLTFDDERTGIIAIVVAGIDAIVVESFYEKEDKVPAIIGIVLIIAIVVIIYKGLTPKNVGLEDKDPPNSEEPK